MSSEEAKPAYDPLPAPRRIITMHNAAGQSVIDTSIPQKLPRMAWPGVELFLAYTAASLPAPLNDGDKDLELYKANLPHNVGIAIDGGLAARFIDFLPGGPEAPLHRTASIDTSVVVEGELEMFLDSGETAVLRRCDVIVQHGTVHGWRNKSETTVARLFAVVTAAHLPVVDGKQLGEDVPLEGLEAK